METGSFGGLLCSVLWLTERLAGSERQHFAGQPAVESSAEPTTGLMENHPLGSFHYSVHFARDSVVQAVTLSCERLTAGATETRWLGSPPRPALQPDVECAQAPLSGASATRNHEIRCRYCHFLAFAPRPHRWSPPRSSSLSAVSGKAAWQQVTARALQTSLLCY